jgi:hypothetical protein
MILFLLVDASLSERQNRRERNQILRTVAEVSGGGDGPCNTASMQAAGWVFTAKVNVTVAATAASAFVIAIFSVVIAVCGLAVIFLQQS